MSRNTRDLRNAGLYLFSILVLAGGLVLGGVLMSVRVDAGSAMQIFASVFDSDSDEQVAPTRLSVAVDNAREIRAALEKPIAPPPPLQPITAKLAHGQLKGGKVVAAKPHHVRLPKAALDAMASADTPAPSPQPLPRVELHRVY